MATPAVARGADEDTVTTNHGCDSTTTCEGKSTSVFVNGTGVHRKGDKNAVHEVPSGPDCVSHQNELAVGSTTVFANGKGIARVGDLYAGTDSSAVVASGSSTVFAGP